jgi:hypothetical protein
VINEKNGIKGTDIQKEEVVLLLSVFIPLITVTLFVIQPPVRMSSGRRFFI